MSTIDEFIKEGGNRGSFFNSIRARLSLVVLVAFAPVFVFVILVSHNQANFEREELERDLFLWVDAASSAREQVLESSDIHSPSWWNSFTGKIELPHESKLVVLDRLGTVVAHHPAVGEHPLSGAYPQAGIILKEESGLIAITNPEGEEQLLAFRPIKDGMGGTEGYLVMEAHLGELFAEVNAFRQRTLGWLIALTILVISVVWLISEAFIVRQVRRLTKASEALSVGDMTVRLGAPYQKGELGQLAKTFDRMADRVASHTADLERKVKERSTQLEEKVKELEKMNQFMASRGMKADDNEK